MGGLALRIAKITRFMIFSLLYIVSGGIASAVPYMWGDRDGCGLLVWIWAVILFILSMVTIIVIAALVERGRSKIKPYVVIFYGSLLLFFLNWIIPFLMVNFNYFSEINTQPWMWMLYVALPFIYGGVAYLFCSLSTDERK